MSAERSFSSEMVARGASNPAPIPPENPKMTTPDRQYSRQLLLAVSLCTPISAHAGNTLRVILTLESPGSGEAVCALYESADGFPSDDEKARSRQWHPAAPSVVCEFTELPDGLYAVGASHDRNGNRLFDTNLVGLPREPWGVSRNARPSLRAPRFDEAAVPIEGGSVTELAIRVQR